MTSILKYLQDPELGEVLFRRNSRAKRYIIRCRNEKTTVTIPRLGSLKEAESFFLKNRDKLQEVLQQAKKQNETKPRLHPDEIRSLKEKAEEFLPAELERLSEAFGFRYKSCKIGKSRTQWGSCSFSGTIILSFYTMLLPLKLIQYILLHELCHTVHHNHGQGFWALLNQCTSGEAKNLRKELRKHIIPG